MEPHPGSYVMLIRHSRDLGGESTICVACDVGGDVKTIGDIIGEMKGLKGADLAKSVGNAGDKVSKVGSVIQDILLLLAVAPK
jgi:hypothetical protein